MLSVDCVKVTILLHFDSRPPSLTVLALDAIKLYNLIATLFGKPSFSLNLPVPSHASIEIRTKRKTATTFHPV
jgi:hypothetical protein